MTKHDDMAENLELMRQVREQAAQARARRVQIPSPPPVATPVSLQEAFDMINKGGWESVMANALSQFDRGRIQEARFLLDFAAEIRLMEQFRSEEFEDLKQKLENGS
jgi:hypothetical protein